MVTLQQSVWEELAGWKCLLGPEVGGFQARTEPLSCVQRKAIDTFKVNQFCPYRVCLTLGHMMGAQCVLNWWCHELAGWGEVSKMQAT